MHLMQAKIQIASWHSRVLRLFAVALLGLLACAWAETAMAAYGNVTQDSEVDPNILRIDEKTFLGTQVDGSYALLDGSGKEVHLADFYGKPLILVLSYYRCDGACSVINRNLKETLKGVDRWQLGQDYRVLTVSFDRHDTPDTMRAFIHKSGFGDHLPEGWTMVTMKNLEDIKRLTGSVGFKFFWSPRDAIFLHPSAYIMLSPKGRVTRYLYGASVGPRDIELAITKAMGGEISAANVINFVLGACYSYNYKDGKYKVNIPLFVAAGGLVFGILLMTGSFLIMKHRREKYETQVSNV